MSQKGPLVEPLGSSDDPIDVCARFLDLPFLLFLDSASSHSHSGEAQQLERFSFLSADPVSLIRSKGRNTEVRHGAGAWTTRFR